MIKKLKMIGDKLLCFSGLHVGDPVPARKEVPTTGDGFYTAVEMLERYRHARVDSIGGKVFVTWTKCSDCGREIR